ncbi:MAG: TrmH family RNA methyltransferase [Candidatus Thalassarchaeaceae archaeon]
MTEVSKALESEEVTLVLFYRGSNDAEAMRLRDLAEERGITVRESSKSDMWRMSRVNDGERPPPILALVGRRPDATVAEILSSGGLCWLLDGARYPVNIGFTIRTAEVSGAQAVFVDGSLNHAEKKAARRASMKAHRFMPVHWVNGGDITLMAKEAGFRVISLEDSGELGPWDEDLTGDILLVVGGERDGISDHILKESDSVIRVPMSGFVPSYNLQAPMAVVAAEALRQRNPES